jgi:hypothetical protein
MRGDGGSMRKSSRDQMIETRWTFSVSFFESFSRAQSMAGQANKKKKAEASEKEEKDTKASVEVIDLTICLTNSKSIFTDTNK